MRQQTQENRYDYFILGLVILLLAIGLVMVYSASHFGYGSAYFLKHFYRIMAGLLAMVFTAFIPYRFWLKSAKLWMLFGIGLLVLVLFIGNEKGNASRWLDVFGYQFQPVDFVRLALIIYLTDAMVRKQEYLHHWKEGILPQLIILGIISVLLLLQPDMGSAIILLVLSAVIFITAGVRFRHLGFIFTAAIPVFVMTKPYQISRLNSYFDSIFHGEPLTYHIKQSLISLGNGGLFGVGLDNSTQKLEFLPEPFTDFIFAIVGEEFGFLGTMILLTIFLLIVMEGYRIAFRCKDKAGAILATGITTSLALYAFINAGVVCNLFPTKGLPMPFISYGGSFMVTSLAGIGILLNISQNNELKLFGKRRRIK